MQSLRIEGTKSEIDHFLVQKCLSETQLLRNKQWWAVSVAAFVLLLCSVAIGYFFQIIGVIVGLLVGGILYQAMLAFKQTSDHEESILQIKMLGIIVDSVYLKEPVDHIKLVLSFASSKNSDPESDLLLKSCVEFADKKGGAITIDIDQHRISESDNNRKLVCHFNCISPEGYKFNLDQLKLISECFEIKNSEACYIEESEATRSMLISAASRISLICEGILCSLAEQD